MRCSVPSAVSCRCSAALCWRSRYRGSAASHYSVRAARDTFGAAIAAWWGGETLVGLGPYIYDASEQLQPLLGGVIGQDRPGYHDWNNLLSWTGLLRHDHAIGGLATAIGYGLMLLGLVWSCWLLRQQFRACQAPSVDGLGALD
jgi:hypothetical protein